MPWLQGKKTYIAAGALVALAIGGFLVGAVSDMNAALLIVAAFGLFGQRAAIGRYQSFIVAGLDELKAKLPAAPQVGATAGRVGNAVAGEIAAAVPEKK